jgi:D,D-heptose 1,7-bisphosphate phosphatase
MNEKTKAVFLDRDGTINIDERGYINHPDKFDVYPFAAEAIKILNELGYKVIVVTNQSGITRGYYTIEDLDNIHKKMSEQLAAGKAFTDAIYFSPYHLEGTIEPYNIHHEDRKPSLGMFRKALQEFNLDIKKSFMVGDRYSDVAFGKKAGLKTILVRTGFGEKEFLQNRKKRALKPDFVVKNLLSAANLIMEFGDKL